MEKNEKWLVARLVMAAFFLVSFNLYSLMLNNELIRGVLGWFVLAGLVGYITTQACDFVDSRRKDNGTVS